MAFVQAIFTNDVYIQELSISPGQRSRESTMFVTELSRSYQGEFTPNAINDLRGVAEELNLSDFSVCRTNHPTAIQRPPFRLIIGSGQNASTPSVGFHMCGLTNDIAPSVSESLWICVRRVRLRFPLQMP
ncbi:hypothetical protein AVEN_144785-1 [Araneus ventricosus]|uniref:Uncharacterized protein n=1 Tax=Araneus ventricosus TaxID=182803 RepID=A0A4Y2LEF8_ARAVE|nr:hypothetical protein AVEN_144785-1 [Araneus ventricosus]